jgi:hypothetical protein
VCDDKVGSIGQAERQDDALYAYQTLRAACSRHYGIVSCREEREKVVVIGDVKSRFVLAMQCRGEHAETLSRICGSGGLQYSARLNIADGPWKTLIAL